ncbi:MAG: hypothetical protein Q4C54_03915 [Clostridia bacterium]|nr:hypothetical protein [Clostridia bacterium]
MTVTVGDVMRHVRCYFEGEEVTVPLRDGHWPEDIDAGWMAVTSPDAFRGVYEIQPGGRAFPAPMAAGYRLYPPSDFLRLCRAIDDWAKEHPPTDAALEQVGSCATRRDGTVSDWQRVFSLRLHPWRRMFTRVDA